MIRPIVGTPTSLVDLAKYPFHDLDSPQAQIRLREWQHQFHEEGVCVLPDFIAPHSLPAFIAQADRLIPMGFHNRVTGNAYLEAVDDSLPADHARRLTETTALSVVAGDQIPETDFLTILYRWTGLTEAIRRIVGLTELYFYDCPLGCLNLSVMQNGDYLRWHFDQSDFVVSIPLQEAESGGRFEFVRNLRSDQDPQYEEVRRVLQGDRTRVHTLQAWPGSLVLFKGKHTLHRVTPIQGTQPRLYALLGYAERPHVGGSDYLRMIRYGRTH